MTKGNKMTQQVPAILKSKKKIKIQEVKPNFTHAEVQRIHSFMRKNLRDLNFFIRIAKGEITEAWDSAIPGTIEGEIAYERLNGLREALRSMKTEEQNMIQIQRKLKKMMS